MNTPRTGDDAGLELAVIAATFGCRPDEVSPSYVRSYTADARRIIAAVRSWDEANAGSGPVADDSLSPADIEILLGAMEWTRRVREELYPGLTDAVCARLRAKPAPGEAAAPARVTRPDVIDCILPSQATGGGLSGATQESAPTSLRDKAAWALFRHKWPQCSKWEASKPSPTDYAQVDIVLAATMLSAGALDTIRCAFDFQERNSEEHYTSPRALQVRQAIDAARAELAALPVRGDGRGVGT